MNVVFMLSAVFMTMETLHVWDLLLFLKTSFCFLVICPENRWKTDASSGGACGGKMEAVLLSPHRKAVAQLFQCCHWWSFLWVPFSKEDSGVSSK